MRSNCEDLSSIWSFIRSSNICFIYLHSFIHPSQVYYELTIWPAPSWLDSSVGRALHRHRRGHGFESCSSLNFFQAFFSQLLKLHSNCEDLSSIWSFIHSSNICFIHLHSVYQLSANTRLIFKMRLNCWPVGQLSSICQPTVGHFWAVCWAFASWQVYLAAVLWQFFWIWNA